MKTIHLNKRKFLMLALPLLLILAMLITSSCSTEGTDQGDNDIQTDDTQSQDIIYPEHEIDSDPEPMSVDESELSLEGYGAVGALSDTDLTFLDMLTYAVQDEYLAHGEYAAIIEEFGNRNPYVNIMRSEEVHLSFLEDVYASYNLEFPADESADHLIIPGDLLEAAETGVQAEIDNIAMYEKFLTYDLPDNLIEVFTALRDGSLSHLSAFQKQVDRLSN